MFREKKRRAPLGRAVRPGYCKKYGREGVPRPISTTPGEGRGGHPKLALALLSDRQT